VVVTADRVETVEAPPKAAVTIPRAFFLVKMQTITVYFKGRGLLIYQAVAHQLNLKNGQAINSEHEFWAILRANASFGISMCEHQMQPKN